MKKGSNNNVLLIFLSYKNKWNELDLFGRPLGKFTEPANFDENQTRMGFGSEAETSEILTK